jgi:hypothetical protein
MPATMHRRIVSTVVLPFLLIGCQAAREPDISPPVGFSLEMDYDGAEALLAALERRTVTDADIDKLLTIRGVQAMVDNTTKYVPADTRDAFRAALKEFVSRRKSTIGDFRLDDSFERAREIRSLIAALEADTNLLGEVAGPISRFMPSLPPFTVTVHGTTGGISDGFVLDNEAQPAFYMALNRAEGDVQGVKLNMTHELYHVVQRMARASVPGLNAKVFDVGTAPSHVRLLSVILEEGTATYVAEPALGKASVFRRSGPYVKSWRASYEKNRPPKRIVANFAEVDRLLSGLRSGASSWEQASAVVFRGDGPGPYFVGYEMAKVIDRHYGPARIASLLHQHPAEFFRAYIDVCRKDPSAVPAKFSKLTEAYIDSIPVQ